MSYMRHILFGHKHCNSTHLANVKAGHFVTHLRPRDTKQKNGVGDFVGKPVGLGVGGVGRGVGGRGVGRAVGVGVGAFVGEQLPPKRLQEEA